MGHCFADTPQKADLRTVNDNLEYRILAATDCHLSGGYISINIICLRQKTINNFQIFTFCETTVNDVIR